MSKTAGKRAPHGATSAMVLLALWQLHTQSAGRVKVSRADLLGALALPETTVDDRLRTLIKEGKVQRVGRARYIPTPFPGIGSGGVKPPGTKIKTRFPNGAIRIEEWH